MPSPEIKIPYETYQRLIDHLSIHAETDAWVKQLLLELQQLDRTQRKTTEKFIGSVDPYWRN
jgi:hypothetical protein